MLEWKVPIDPPGAELTLRIILADQCSSRCRQTRAIPSGSQPHLCASDRWSCKEFRQCPWLVHSRYVGVNQAPGIADKPDPPASIPQCEPHNGALLGGSGTSAFDFSVQVTEGSTQSFNYRNYGTELFGPEFPPALLEQNVPGFNYSTETGFYSPSLFTSAPTVGLADFGTAYSRLTGFHLKPVRTSSFRLQSRSPDHMDKVLLADSSSSSKRTRTENPPPATNPSPPPR